jgi:hypothetical protein
MRALQPDEDFPLMALNGVFERASSTSAMGGKADITLQRRSGADPPSVQR